MPILLKQRARQTRSRSFVVLSEHLCGKSARLSAENYKKKRVFFVSLGRPGASRKRAPILTKQRRVNLHPILHSTRPNIPAEDQRGFLSESYKKTQGLSSVSAAEGRGKKAHILAKPKPPQTP